MNDGELVGVGGVEVVEVRVSPLYAPFVRLYPHRDHISVEGLMTFPKECCRWDGDIDGVLCDVSDLLLWYEAFEVA